MFEWSPGLPIVDEIIPLSDVDNSNSDDEETDDVANESDDELDNIEPIDAENDDDSDDRIIHSVRLYSTWLIIKSHTKTLW